MNKNQLSGYTASASNFEHYVESFKTAEERLTASAILSGDLKLLRETVKKLFDCNKSLVTVLDACYKKLQDAQVELSKRGRDELR